MEYSGPLGVKRPLGVAPLASPDSKWIAEVAQEAGQQTGMTREQFIKRCKESENSKQWATNFAAAFIGEEAAQEIPVNKIEESSESFCKGLADFFGF